MKIINKLFPSLTRKNYLKIFDSRQKLRESNELFYSLFHNATIGLYQTTPEGQILSANPSIIKMLKFDSMQDLLKRDLSKGSYVHEDKRIEFKKILQEKGEIIDFESEWYTKNGEIIYVLEGARAVKNKNGRVVRYDGSVLNTTDKRKAEIALEKALEKAKESDRLKSAFLANMSHEIRTPMNGILGFADLLKKPDLSNEIQEKYIEIIEKGGKRMLNIINEIIDISKIESGQMPVSVSAISLNQFLEESYMFFKSEAEKKKIEFILTKSLHDEDALITTDKDKLNGIFTNLIKNALKYTKAGSIEFGYQLKNSKTEIEFYVKDTGIGIPKNRQTAIFERFIQADLENKMAQQGAGLGLAISKGYVELLHGTIWVESQEDLGTTFYFTLPYNKENRSATMVPHSNEDNQKRIQNLKVVIVEDDETSGKFLQILIEEFAKEIINVKTGNDAIAVCKNNPDIDLVLMDIQIPGLNGYDATQQIRKFNQEVIIIAQTAFALSGEREKAIECGCNDYISKPIQKDKLLSLLQKYFT